MKDIPRLTDLEITLMKVLWEHDTNLTIQEIANSLSEKKISVASVTQAMKHLTAKKAVMVGEHVLVSNVYARTFFPCFSREEFLAAEFRRMQKSIFGAKKVNTISIIATLLNIENGVDIKQEDAKKLQEMIDSIKTTNDEE